MDGEDLYLDIGSGVPKMQLVGSEFKCKLKHCKILIPSQKDEREAAFMAVWRDEVVKKLGYGLRLPRSVTWTKTKD